uniref:beta-glucosidase n=1 Tax=Phyllotreta striolata TaxID=444603 RepID=A0A059UDK9_PHYSR|nr:glycoside hydrolase family 1 [Phyllotreta striolata]
MAEKKNDSKFPDDFLFGVSTSAYQIEGSTDVDGRGENNYDFYIKTNPEKFNHETALIACDSYSKWRGDLELIKSLGVNTYRFSISWNRILPTGYANRINQKAIKHYSDLIDGLLLNGIQPMVTMCHFEIPMSLQHLGGWTNRKMADHFAHYAEVLFKHFGDRVKYWVTINTTDFGYSDDIGPPFMNQPGIANYMSTGCMVLAHAKAYEVYKRKFAHQKGKVGLVVDARWYEPADSGKEHLEAAEIAREFEVGMFLNPLYHPDGDFPEVVKRRVETVSKIEGYPESRLPSFTREEIDLMKGSCDFIGANLYTSFLVKRKDDSLFDGTSTLRDEGAEIFQDPSWKGSASSWLKVRPDGAVKVLQWIKEKYNNPDVYVTENGFSDLGGIEDIDRIDYLKSYMKAVLEAIDEHRVAVKGYFVWSLLDNFEWASGYKEKFGLFSVDFTDPNRARTPKKSALWYSKVVKERKIVP